MPDSDPYRFAGEIPQRGLLALQPRTARRAARLVLLEPDRTEPKLLVTGGDGDDWSTAVVHGGYAWLVGRHTIVRADLESGDTVPVHWFGRDRPEQVACSAGPAGLVVATDRHIHWFPVAAEKR